MSKVIAAILLLFAFASWGQDAELEKEWNKLQKELEYGEARRKSGPSYERIYPNKIEDYVDDEEGEGYTTPAENANDEEIIENRNSQFGPYTGDGGIKKNNRESVIKQAPTYEPDIPDLPEVEPLDVDPPKRWEISENIWQVILIILLLIIVVALLYYFLIRNVNTEGERQYVVPDLEEWNPEEVSKSELEILLEKALEKEDYRQCVRVYYTFILQSLIKKGWIKYKQDKTNVHYQIEMMHRPVNAEFSKAVRLYELVWYGHYDINALIYQSLEPELKALYKKIDANEGE
ncbi:hypothetical protein SAMN05216474_1552 [Lishizhenia tianjinensis]|uniref:DUF4129 domain-containing protein n=1 Tax=Lishizhenia tianjinensis TaxID=477690 RepID=A0A1I6ZQR2_9FLAO|nr:hypothetical protein [Lishizhenia tianjinensis]SFT65048.1 hypothetical protein SAMN05216474_1552 [Lishizhenia tianjinensis]